MQPGNRKGILPKHEKLIFYSLAASLLIFAPGCEEQRFDSTAIEIPQNRLIQYRPGVEGGIPDVDLKEIVTPSELQSQSDAAKIIQEKINHMEPPGAILLPAGEFTIRSPLTLRSGVVLRGMGADKTHLRIDIAATQANGAIVMAGSVDEREFSITGGAEAGSKALTVEDGAQLQTGQIIQIYSENNPGLLYTNPEWNQQWAQNSLGQIVRITKVVQQSIEIDVPLRLTHQAELNPRLRALKPIEYAGIESLHLRRNDRSDDIIISIQTAVNCWVKDLESEYGMRAHIWIWRSRFVTITDNYLHHAWDYGGGGYGYGVVVGRHSTDCLISNNILQHFRHSLMTKEGANGNVFSYNFSTENVDLCDISIHGHYSYMNLFEGNVFSSAIYADYWGPTGPLTTMFRNRVSDEIEIRDHSDNANILCNTVGKIKISEDSEDALIAGNVLTSYFFWQSPDTPPAPGVFPSSLYLKEKPDFWGSENWPGIGADVDVTKKKTPLPAEVRFWRLKKR